MAEIGTEASLPFYERSSFATGAIFGDLAGIADRRTLEILERRRTSNPHRRGWLVRRLLVLADVVGLVLAFAAVEALFGAGGGAGNRATSVEESLLLLATLPGWIVIAKLYRLYDQDEERTHHPTTDDFSGVFHLVTVGVWLLFAGTWVFGVAHPDISKLIAFWAAAIGLVTLARAVRPEDLPAQHLVPPEHDHRRRRRRRPAGRAEAPQASGVRDQPRRLRRLAAPAEAGRARPGRVARFVRAPAGARAAAGRRANRDRVLERLVGGDAGARSLARGRRGADRHRPAPVRARQPARPGRHGRGPAARRAASEAALAVVTARSSARSTSSARRSCSC